MALYWLKPPVTILLDGRTVAEFTEATSVEDESIAATQREARLAAGLLLAGALQEDAAAAKVGTVRGPGQPAGRNDPCPCGSGKKFKKCCRGR